MCSSHGTEFWMCMYFESRTSLQSPKIWSSSLWRFSQCSASPKFSSKKEKCPFGTHCGIAWGCLLVFLGNARMLLWSAHTIPYFAWDRLSYFSFLLMSSPFSVTEDYFPSFSFLNSWSSLIKRKNKLKGHFKFRNIPNTDQRALSPVCWNILRTGQEAPESSGIAWKYWRNWSGCCLPLSFLPAFQIWISVASTS